MRNESFTDRPVQLFYLSYHVYRICAGEDKVHTFTSIFPTAVLQTTRIQQEVL